jgi:peroxiredoxin (alkyl hydroperoxide reductase subunit C)
LIDERVKIFHESVNDMPLGNVNEYIRMVDAYTHIQEGEVCPITGKLVKKR